MLSDRALWACDSVHNVRTTVHLTDFLQCTMLCTVYGHCSKKETEKKKKKRDPFFFWGVTRRPQELRLNPYKNIILAITDNHNMI